VAGLPLVTGAAGFAGSHLLDQLLEREPAVDAWARTGGARPPTRDPRINWLDLDVLDRAAVHEAISRLQPSIVYHCAGAADVGTSWADPVTPVKVNAMGTHHLLDAVRSATSTTKVVVVGSAAVYRPSTAALDEDAATGPTSPYGFSKLAQEMIAAAVRDFPVVIARPFNHAGPRQSSSYVTSSFARQIAEIEAAGKPPTLRVGNLDARRDVTDVRDVARAYQLLGERGQAARIYNICSGQAYRIGDLLEQLLSRARKSIAVEHDPARMRPSDQPVILGSAARAASELGWRPTIPIADTLTDLLEYWRDRVAAARG
jgi:GDP-4-dehydro-6-deoxy-D-mannose reductase